MNSFVYIRVHTFTCVPVQVLVDQQMKFDVKFANLDLKKIPDTARRMEALGFDAAWSWETAHDPFLPLALAAEHTGRISLGTAIAVAFPRSPMLTAQIAWDLAAQSNGRFILGLGTQVKAHNERRFSLKWDSPGKRLREVLLALRAIWNCWQNGGPLNFRGEFYQFTLMTPFFNPGPIAHPNVPIFIAGTNPYLCRLAGELADGLHVHPFHSVKYIREVVLPNIGAGAAAAGRTRAAVQLASSVFTVTGNTPEEMAASREATKSQIAFYASTPTYRIVLETHGWGEASDRLGQLAREGKWAEMRNLISDEMLAQFAVTAPLDELAAAMREQYAGLLDRVGYYESYEPKDEAEDRWWAESARVVRRS